MTEVDEQFRRREYEIAHTNMYLRGPPHFMEEYVLVGGRLWGPDRQEWIRMHVRSDALTTELQDLVVDLMNYR